MPKLFLFTSESATIGHPDRLCDTISDALVDQFLRQDPYSRIIAECAISKGMVFVAVRFASKAAVDIAQAARSVIEGAGYRKQEFDTEECTVVTSLIAMPVEQRIQADEADLAPAELDRYTVHNQTTLFGFACTHTPELMPLTISLSHRLTRELAMARKSGLMPFLGPDGKSQVTVEYAHGKPVRIHTVVVSTQHTADIDQGDLRESVQEQILAKVLPAHLMEKHPTVHINPTGQFIVGGPHGDAGLTGRKIIVDTYGGVARHGGGAFSGKDPTKVDRSAAYAARYVAKNVVAAGLADRFEVQLSYAIGVARPVSISIESFGTAKIDEVKLAKLIDEMFDLRPGAIIRDLKLRRPIYRQTAAYGHFGRTDIDLPWEATDKADALRRAAGL